MLEYSDANTKMVGTTNSMMEQFLGKTGHLMDYYSWTFNQEKKDIQVGESAYFDMLQTYMYTSTIQDIEENGDLIIIKTNNSTYTFEKL